MSDLLLEENAAQEMIEPLTIIQQAAYGLDATLTNLLIALSPQIALDTIADDSYALIPFLQAVIDEATQFKRYSAFYCLTLWFTVVKTRPNCALL